MTTIRITEAGIQNVVSSTDRAGHETMSVATWLTTHALPQSALTVLGGHGLTTAHLMTRLELVSGQLAREATLLFDAADVARAQGNALLGSQVFEISRPLDWHSLKSVYDLGDELVQRGGRLLTIAGYAIKGELGEHMSRWKPFGHFNAATYLGAGALAEVLGVVVGGSAGGVISSAGQLTTSAFTLGTVIRHGKQYTTILGKGGGRLVTGLSAITVGINVYELATSDWDARVHGDAEGHSQTSRNWLYGAKVVDTIGAAAMTVAPFAGPAAPVVLGIGAGLSGAAALVEGTVAATDWLHEHPETVDAVKAGVKNVASEAWSVLKHPRIPAFAG